LISSGALASLLTIWHNLQLISGVLCHHYRLITIDHSCRHHLFLSTGIGSPEIIDSSIDALTIGNLPSTIIFSPGFVNLLVDIVNKLLVLPSITKVASVG
jgi:hypothetical protein